MSAKQTSTLSPKEMIDILLKEYVSLRSEINLAHSSGFQLGAITVAGITWMGTRQHDHLSYVLIVVLAVAVLLFAAVIWRDMYVASRRITEIEYEINGLAGRKLLKWELEYSPGGIGPTGWIIKWRVRR